MEKTKRSVTATKDLNRELEKNFDRMMVDRIISKLKYRSVFMILSPMILSPMILSKTATVKMLVE